jgi:TonB-dependent SusC/RagA subfamily outer membrane receptor
MAQQASPRWKVLQFAVCLPLILSLGMFFSVNFLQALPVDNGQQSLREVIKKWEQTPVITRPTTAGLIHTEEKTLQNLPSAGKMTLAALPKDTTAPQTIVVTSSDKSGNALEIKGKNAKMLVVVDGKKVGTMGNGGEAVISNLNADNISTVSVLKGESATAVYGAEGQDGVVIVNTKTNSDDKMVVKISSGADVSFTMSSNNSADGVGTSSSVITTSSGKRSLILVDGKIIGRMGSNDLESLVKKLNPENIDSMNALLGKYATKKYGAEGEDGVIEIFLKKRKK